MLLKKIISVLFCVVFACSACSRDNQASSKPQFNNPATAPNIVLIVIDTLRADHLPFYGYSRDTAPFLSTLADRSVVFEQATATASYTAPATASIHTGLYPFQHGVLLGMNATKKLYNRDPVTKLNKIPDEIQTLAELLKTQGYRTFGVADNGNISAGMGFDQGFEFFETFRNRGADVVNQKVQDWHEQIKAGKYFLYLHYMDPHSPYLERSPWFSKQGSSNKNLIAAYDSEINYTDQHIKELATKLGWSDDTVIIVTADHGEEFWEHGQLGHGKSLYSEVMHVPFVFHYPGGGFKPQRISQRVSTVDLFPTFLELFGLTRSDSMYPGMSLVGVLSGVDSVPSERALVGELWKRLPGGKESSLRSLTRDVWRLIRVDEHNWQDAGESPKLKQRLFNLKLDPGEKRNQFSEQGKLAKELNDSLEGERKAYQIFNPVAETYDFSKLEDVGAD